MTKLPPRIVDYLTCESARCKPGTVAFYRQCLKYFCGLIKIKKISALTTAQLNAYIIALAARNIAPYTKVNHLFAVRKYLQWEVQEEMIAEKLAYVLDRSKLPPVPEYLPRPLSKENDIILQNKLRKSDSPYAVLFLLLRQTGLRISELINLPPDCVLTSPQNEKYLKVPLGKMNTERLVPLTKESIDIINNIRKSPPLRIKCYNPDRLLGLGGNAYAHLADRFKKISGDMTDQGKPITFHRLRHTYATTLLSAGVSLVSLMKLLGHRRIEMTLRYAKVTPSHLRDEYLKAIEVLEKQLAPVETHTCGELATSGQPIEILNQLGVFLDAAALTSTRNKKNLLLRISRLKQDFTLIRFSKKFVLRQIRANRRAD
jgi:site-specific recombinase XerD